MAKTLIKRCSHAGYNCSAKPPCKKLIRFDKRAWKGASRRVYRQPNYCQPCWVERAPW